MAPDASIPFCLVPFKAYMPDVIKTLDQEGLRQLARPEWTQVGLSNQISYTAYQISPAHPRFLEEQMIVDFDGLRAILFFGAIVYLPMPKDMRLIHDASGKVKLNYTIAGKQNSQEHLWLILLQPCSGEQLELDSSEALFRADAYAGLFCSVVGDRPLFTRGVSNVFDPATLKLSCSDGPIEVRDGFLISPYFSEDRVGVVSAIAEALRTKPADERRRIELALHWYYRGCSMRGLDAFLSLWIALEALVMRGPDLLPLKRSLARAYNTDIREANTRFRIGRLFAFRSKIVHQGLRPTISDPVLDYVNAIFVDALSDVLQTRFDARAHEWLGCNKSILDVML